jgi:hypothetical protein
LIPGFTNILRDTAVANVSLLKDLLFANQKKNRRKAIAQAAKNMTENHGGKGQ